MRSKKAFKNTITALIYQVVVITCGLITPRLILQHYGSTYNGVISSATQFMSLISLLTLGIAGSTRVALYKTLAENDTFGTSRIIKANQQYMHKVGIAIVVYAVLLMIVYPFVSHTNLNRFEVAALVGIVSCGTFVEYFFGITYKTLLTADQKEYISSSVQIVVTIINTLVAVAIIGRDGSVYLFKSLSIFIFALAPITINIYVNHRYNIKKNCDPDTVALDQRKAVAAHSIANIVHDNTDLVILTLFCDAKIISVYTVYNFVVGRLKQLMRSFTNGLESAFGNMWVKKEYEALNRNFRLYEYFISCFISIIFSCVIILLIPFVKLYTKGVTDVEYVRLGFSLLMITAEIVFVIRQPYLTLVQATGNYEATKNGAIIEASTNILLSILLVNILGLNGVVIGTIVANLIRSIQYIIFVSNKILDRNLFVVIKRVAWIILNLMINVLVIGFIASHIDMTTWQGWVMNGFIGLIVALILTIISSMFFYKDDLVGMIKIGKRMIRRKK